MGCFSSAAIVILSFLILLKLYLKLTTKWCKSKTCLVGKTVIVTGANAGIGYEAALDFARRGAKVILACRDQRRADEARLKIIKETGNTNVIVKILDLASFQSVREFAKEINKTEERLDILINNAGASIGTPDFQTKDGYNVKMQINYYSNFLLTHLLIDLLKKSGPSRVINLSSNGASHVRNFDVDKLDAFTGSTVLHPYSKLCMILFTRELAKRLRGSLVTTYSLYPGLVNTGIFKSLEGYIKIVVDILVSCYSKTPEEGAQTTIYTAVATEIENLNGEHFEDCARVEPYKSVLIPGLEKKLWEKTVDLIKMKPEEVKV